MPDSTYERLLQLGKQQGGLTTDDLQRVLDLERLSLDQVSEMLLRLEDAGVSVDIEPAILKPRSGSAGTNQQPDISLLEAREPPLPQASRASSDPGSAPEGAKGSPTVLYRQFAYLSDKTVWISVAVALGGILLLALLLAITF
jgi:hypothetical protein